ncbi:hypothetical protein HMPREF0495_01069 [Levilactobacillus brevis ATCC 14869 = DSM 20054]|uniref:Uncharacterized protein n=1 Tax=Levilactobacillus brevis ATCC 14869 = DSM 20054 TaxID=649758 RepID=U2PKG7_LEVBR|nr:hypothetical protein HMPREF0495_01069 [Levilactobacillus brevis ATCC 14869 = DSM 20054]
MGGAIFYVDGEKDKWSEMMNFKFTTSRVWHNRLHVMKWRRP